MGKNLHWKWEGKLEFEKSCQERFANKVIMFEEMLEIKQVISLCYERQKTLNVYEQVLKAQVWAFAKTIPTCLNRSLVMNACVMNQPKVIGCYLMLWVLQLTRLWH